MASRETSAAARNSPQVTSSPIQLVHSITRDCCDNEQLTQFITSYILMMLDSITRGICDNENSPNWLPPPLSWCIVSPERPPRQRATQPISLPPKFSVVHHINERLPRLLGETHPTQYPPPAHSWRRFSICTYLSLSVHGRVPVGVVEDDGVRPGKVDAEPAGTRRQDEAEKFRVQVEPVKTQTRRQW